MIRKWLLSSWWPWHLIYWALSVYFLFYFISIQVGPVLTPWFSVFLAPLTIITTYFFTHFLIPIYLNKKQYLKFFLYSAYAIILSVYFEMIVIIILFIFVADLDIKLAYFDATFLLIGMYIPVVVGIAIRLYRILQKSEERNLKLLQQKTEAELKFLKSQINPHFLFNTLNNLYSLALDKSDKAPEVVLKLSELLSFILYDCRAERIPLVKEIEQMENYISLEELRYDKKVSINKEIQPGIDDLKILPLIFLPLMENCFKHGIKPSVKKGWIRYSIQFKDETLFVNIGNSIPSKPDFENRETGIGLENLKNRLSLYYGENYALSYQRNKEDFTVRLEIKILP
ncbi:MAG TPA: histidine kinase [Cyclobacteriaceae bacterium]|nr:histidine kinase [Cyclobacteriaceae bacterium]